MASIVRHHNQWRAFIRKKGSPGQSRVFSTKQDAQRWARAEEARLDNVVPLPVGLRYTLNDLIEEYQLHTLRGGRSKQLALKAIGEALGGFRLGELSTSTLISYVHRRRGEGAGPATINQDLAYISSVLRHGGALKDAHEIVAPALIALNAARFSARHAGLIGVSKERNRRPASLELMQLKDRFQRWRGNTPMWHIVSFAIATAMRLSEIMRIDWGDIDWEDRTLLIRDRKHPNQKKGNNQLIPLLEGCSELCNERLSALDIILKQKEYLEARKAYNPSGRVFPYPAHSISVMFRQTCAELKIVDLHFHDLRHEGVSRLFEAGYTIEQVALVSGHKDWKQLRRYTNIKAASLHRN